MINREWYIPKGAVKIADKQSDAIAYLYVAKHTGSICAKMFYGKQTKPVWALRFRNEQERAERIERGFQHRCDVLARKKEERAKRTAFKHSYKPGDIFRRSWGYEQTNIDYYEVIATTDKTVTVREIARETVETGWCRGKTTPQPGVYTGKPKRCLAQDGHIKINSYSWAYYVKPDVIAGVPVYGTDEFTSYA